MTARWEDALAKWVIEFDGASSGNPGPAGYGFVVRDAASGKIVDRAARSIGVATNNEAEYRALIAALRYARKHRLRNVEFRSDSQLVVNQMQGNYRVRASHLQPLYDQARRLWSLIPGARIRAVPRGENRAADALARRAARQAKQPQRGQA